MRLGRICLILLIAGVLSSCGARAAWTDLLDVFVDDAGSSGLTNSEIILGLKEALSISTDKSISLLGQVNGFYKNKKVKISVPSKLEKLEDILRKLKQDEIADEFILSMNRAAESAVPEATAIFSNAIRSMTFSDAKNILQGPDDAATSYFKYKSSRQLNEKMLPLVQRATSQANVSRKYKSMINKLDFAADYVNTDSLDLDQYVTEKAIDGLFVLLAEQEKLIREDSTARTTAILKKVFSQE